MIATRISLSRISSLVKSSDRTSFQLLPIALFFITYPSFFYALQFTLCFSEIITQKLLKVNPNIYKKKTLEKFQRSHLYYSKKLREEL